MDRRILLVGLFSFLLVGAVAAGVLLFSRSEGFRGTGYAEPYPPAAEIELVRSNGDSFRLSELRGNVVLLFFGYTSCPDVCPTTMAELKQALEKLSEEDASQVQVLFVTVDPERDTPERVQQYVDHFNPDFIGLSGTEAELAGVWRDYGVFRAIVDGTSAAGYLVDHTARVTVIDEEGQLRLSYPFDTPVDNIVHDLKLLLREKRQNASR
ncbi:MAG TPA: SCO family protein [Anaerolineales bacterium]|nr:SCO family protein [Anaerolineales bacterium]